MVKSFGFTGRVYNQIIVFKSAEMLKVALEANPHMEPIIGAGQSIDCDFPGVYMAGIRDNSRRDNTVAVQTAIQR
jgi:hypothetical protein